MSQTNAEQIRLLLERFKSCAPMSDEQLSLFEEIPMDAMTEAQVYELYAAMGEEPCHTAI